MRDLLKGAGFENIVIETKENAADIIKDWMPGSGAENYVTSVYVTASKPTRGDASVREDVHRAAAPELSFAVSTDAAADAGC